MKLGQLIKEQRKIKKISLKEVANFLRIKPKYLTAIENDEIDFFSSKVYYQGYLKQYIKYLELNLADLNWNVAEVEKELIIIIPEADRYNPSAMLSFIALCICLIIYNICGEFIC